MFFPDLLKSKKLEPIEAEWRICISNLTIIGSDNGLSRGQYQAIIWTNVGILLIEQTSVKS